MTFKSISIIGLGYIGLPTAAVFASRKQKVIGVDVIQDTVDIINAGKVHIVEPGLELMVEECVKSGFLRAVTSPEPADTFLITVPTPFLKHISEDSLPKPDLSYVESASRSVAKVLKKGDVVILESTSPVGTTEKMAKWLAQERPDLTFPQSHGSTSDIRIAYCPERVLPGNVINELITNDRVIGGMTERCSEAAIQVYSSFVEGNCVTTNARTAEMTKLTENASRDVGIAFANELSVICDDQNIDVWELIRLANLHPRVSILQPGPGVGGHCIAVDPWFIVDRSPNHSKLIKAARNVNNQKPQWVVDKVKLSIADILLKNPSKSSCDISIACYGLAFKPNIDDLRESPALLIAKKIIEIHSGAVLLVEPNITSLPESLKKGQLSDLDKSIEEADLHLLLVDHSDFYRRLPTSGVIIDTRGIWSA
jgi:UDP-N-acetyl-D-mannosaminuronic acid dehydrogenase